MLFTIKKNTGTPAYLQLYEHLRESIISGVSPYGTKLPSKRLIAQEAGVSVVTVEHAIALLCDEGYAGARERSGCFVTYREDDLYPTAGIHHAQTPSVERMADFDASRYFPFSVYARTIRKVLADYGERILIASENTGSVVLRDAIASYLARSRGIRVKSTQIVVGSGAEYLYGLIAQLLQVRAKNNTKKSGKKNTRQIVRVAIENPSYHKIRKVYEANGIICDALKMGTDGIRTKELSRTHADVLHVTPFNSYPSGITSTAGKRAEYIRWVLARDGLIVEDDFDSEFTISAKAKDTVFGLASKSADGHVIYMNTFSRTIAPGVRIGYMVLPEKLRRVFEKELGFYACTVPVFEQYVLAEFMNSGDFERHINRVRRRIRESGDARF